MNDRSKKLKDKISDIKYVLLVKITYKNTNKVKEYISTDFPTIGDRWVTLYDNSKRLMIPTEGIAELEYDISQL